MHEFRKKLKMMVFQTKEIHWLMTVCCLLAAIITIQGRCPIPCKCYYISYYGPKYGTDCNGRGLKVVPNGTFENSTQWIYLHKNELTSLPAGIFNKLKKVLSIALRSNRLTSLPAGIFDDNELLLYLYLDDNQLTSLPEGILNKNSHLTRLYLGHNQLTSLPDGIFDKNPRLTIFRLSYNRISSLHRDTFKYQINLQELDLAYNQLTSLPDGIFDESTHLTKLWINKNKITSLHAGIIFGNKQLTKINWSINLLTHLPPKLFDNNRNLTILQITHNRISSLHRDTFKYQINLQELSLQGNKLKDIPQGVFRNCPKLSIVSLFNNIIQKIPEDLLQGATNLYALALGKNKIQRLPDGFLKDSKRLGILSLDVNNLQTIDVKRFTKLHFLLINQNRITSRALSRAVMNNLTRLSGLAASYNQLEHISDYTFLRSSYLKYIILANNRLRSVTNRTFYGASQLQILYLLQTKIKSVDIQWFNPSIYSIGTAVQIYPSHTSQTLQVMIDQLTLEEVFLLSGFNCTRITKDPYLGYCTPCLSGSYVKADSKGLCWDCPAGGFYEDSIAFYGERAYGNGCKMCDNGTFVHLKNAPGRRQQDCKPCPEGTQNIVFAGFRACPCQDGFYRLDRFEKCYTCSNYGVTCFNESMTLKPGYYWQWISQSEKEHYVNFTNNLQIFDDSYNRDLVTFKGSFPKHYQCPRSMSCLGGLNANCAEGYTGPLCAVCDERHYNLVATCFKCPKLGWLIFQISAISLIVITILFLVIKLRHRQTRGKRSLSDIILARLKIIVSFYQIFSSTLDGFSYVQWPSALTKISEYAKFVQLNIIQIAPLHCFNSSYKMNAYDHLVTVCAVTAAVILMAVVYYNFKRLYFHKKALNSSDLEATKEACYRNVFLFMFVTYPQTCSTIFQMLPEACHRICQDSSQTQCTFYLKADYSITCFTDKYNRYVILAYAALVYPFAVPLLTAAVLWKCHYKNLRKKASHQTCGKMIRKRSKASCGEPIEESQGSSKTAEQMETTLTKHGSAGTEKTNLSRDHNNKTDNDILISFSNEIHADSENGRVESIVEGNAGKQEKERRYSESTATASIPIVAGMSFIFENYAENCWFWETIEMMRKLLLTSSLALIGAEGRTSLGVASILSGCYAILHAHFKPIPDKFEHVLQLTSLLVTFANTCIGMMLKIDQGALPDADSKIMDSWIMTALLVMANVMVTALVVVKCVQVVGQTIYSVIKNPRCSLACCLSVILTFDEVQGEARSMESSSGWEMKTQLQSGNEFEGLSLEDAAGDYGLTGIDMNDGENDNRTTNKTSKKE